MAVNKLCYIPAFLILFIYLVSDICIMIGKLAAELLLQYMD